MKGREWELWESVLFELKQVWYVDERREHFQFGQNEGLDVNSSFACHLAMLLYHL